MLTGRVVLGYARYLGIDPETEPRLVDVAREALTDPMPVGWERHLNEEYCRPFFFSEREGIATWEHPLLRHYLAKVDALRATTAENAHLPTPIASIYTPQTSPPPSWPLLHQIPSHVLPQLQPLALDARHHQSRQHVQPPPATMHYWAASCPYQPLLNALPHESTDPSMLLSYAPSGSCTVPAMDHAATSHSAALQKHHVQYRVQHTGLASPATLLPGEMAPPDVSHAQPSVRDPSQMTDLERLRLQQVERYQQHLLQLQGYTDRADQSPSQALSSNVPSQHWQEQRRKQWQRLQELQHEHIERQLRENRGGELSRSGSEPVGVTRSDATADGQTADAEGTSQTDRKPPGAFEAPPQPVQRTSLELGERFGEGGRRVDGADADTLPTLKQLAAPLVGIMGSALQRTASAGAAAATALKRRGSAAAAAASAAASAGHGAAAAAAAAAFTQPIETPLPPPPPSAGPGGGSVAQVAAAEVEAAEKAFRVACEVLTATLEQQREALSASAAHIVNEAMGSARARVHLVFHQLGAMVDHAGSSTRAFAAPAVRLDEDSATSGDVTAAGSAESSTMLATGTVDACAALSDARDARMLEVEATLRACEKRIDALRSTRLEASASLIGSSNGIFAAGSSATEAAGTGQPTFAEVMAADKALKELDTSAAFELEQALWRGGLRGAALQARVQLELDDLREQWREHRAKVEHAAVEDVRRREAQKKSLAAYVHRSMVDAATHSLSRLLEVAAAAAGDLTATALRALHQRTIAMQRTCGAFVDHERSDVWNAEVFTSSLMHRLVDGAEALVVQLHAELTSLVEAVAAAATQAVAWVRADEELTIVARQADEEARGAVGASERAMEARCAAFDDDVLQMRHRALESFERGLALTLNFGEALLVGELLRVAPSRASPQSVPPPPHSAARQGLATTVSTCQQSQSTLHSADSSHDCGLAASAPKTLVAAAHSSWPCRPVSGTIAVCQPAMSATSTDVLPRQLPCQRAVARPCTSVCAPLPRASCIASAEANTPPNPHVPASPDEAAECGGAPTMPMTPRVGAPRAFAEAWLNSRGSLLSPNSKGSLLSPDSRQTADTRASPFTGADDGKTQLGGALVDGSPHNPVVTTAVISAGCGDLNERLAAAPLEEALEPLVARQLQWEELDIDAAAVTAAVEIVEEAAAAAVVPEEGTVEGMLAFLDEATQEVQPLMQTSEHGADVPQGSCG